MEVTLEALTAAALRIPPADRARMIEALIASLDAPLTDTDAQWLAEAERRDRALAADPGAGRPASAVFAGARTRLVAGEFEQ